MQKEYNFDGFRVDHIDHIVDEVSEKDGIPISVNDEEGRRMIRVYTVNQIDMYIRTKIDPDFCIDKYLTTCKQVKISDADLENIIKPETNGSKKKKLF